MTDPRSDVRISDELEIQRLVEAARGDGMADGYSGKRHWTRFNAGMACELATDPTNTAAQWFVTLHNVSGGGFACWSKTKLASRARIFVREFSAEQPGVWIPARVCHCSTGLRGFLIGAAFENQVSSGDTGNGAPGLCPRGASSLRPAGLPAFARPILPGKRR